MSRRAKMGVSALLVVACVAIYARMLGHGFVTYDDPRFVTENPEVQRGLSFENVRWAFTNDREAYFIPVAWLSHMADCDLFGLRPWGHHLTNLVFHALNAVVLFLVLSRMTGAPWPSALVAALFAVHPLNVESVAWVSERKNLLSTLFWFLAMGAYGSYARRPRIGAYALVVGLFAVGLMCKPMLVTLPCVFLLLDYWPLDRFPGGAKGWSILWRALRLAAEKLPLLALSVADAMATFRLQQTGADTLPDGTPLLGPQARIVTSVVACGTYLAKAVIPAGLALHYPQALSWAAWRVVGSAVLLTAITVLAVWQARQRRYLATGWLWYIGTLLPVSQMLQAHPFAYAYADRYTYVPLIGVFIMAAWGLADAAGERRNPVVVGGSVSALAALALAAVVQTGYWHDSITLYRHSLEHTANNSLIEYDLGHVLHAQGSAQESAQHFLEAVRISPDFVEARFNLGTVLAEMGRKQDAIREFDEVIRRSPSFAPAHASLGAELASMGRLSEAMRELRKALEIDPGLASAEVNLANLLAASGQQDEALDHYEHVLQAGEGPMAEICHMNAGVVLATGGKNGEAIEHFRAVLRHSPRHADAHNNLGMALVREGQIEEGVAEFREAVAIDPRHALARKNLKQWEARATSRF